jgi:uncharacterized protein YqhQ
MILYVIILLSIIPTHYLLYKILKKRFELSKRLNMNLTGILSITFGAIGALLADVLPDSLRGNYASAGGDLTIIPIMFISFFSLTFMLVYVLVINFVLLGNKEDL